jgi:hypothetical protein
MQRGNTVTDASFNSIITFSTNTNPIVLLDKAINKMYICIATTMAASNLTVDTIISTKNSTGQNTSGYIVTTIDYIPLQRWVYIGIVVKDYTLYVFLDGDLYSATTVYDVSSAMQSQSRPIVKGTNGDLILGEKMNTTPGYISQSKFYNYALTQKEMLSNYSAGPIKSSILSMIGLKQYGVRSPIYELQ